MQATPVPKRIAMWSGPRNISTAMMRAWENRADTVVVDEPFYASYLDRTGLDHPGREQVLASQPRDYRQVVQQLQQLSPPGHSIVYQKQMTHHIAADMDLDWLGGMTHGFLLRQPRKMLASLLRVLPDAGVDDTGLPQQLRLYRSVCECSESAPPVVDSDELLRDPQTMLTRLCTALGVEFDQAMLHWPAGPRASDGVWAPYWYASVERSTGFAAPVDSNPEIPSDKHAVLDTCEKIYSELSEHRIRP